MNFKSVLLKFKKGFSFKKWYYFEIEHNYNSNKFILNMFKIHTEYRYCPKNKILQEKTYKGYINIETELAYVGGFDISVANNIKRIDKEYNRKIKLKKLIK